MNIVAIREGIAIDAPKPAIAELQEQIVAELKEIERMRKTGFVGRYKNALDAVNAKIDYYIEAKQLRRV